jgi:hypothetical protein
VQDAAGVRHHRRHAEFGEHIRGRFHLGGAAHRVPAGAVDDPLDRSGVGRGQFGRDVLAQPRLVSRGAGRLEGLSHRRGHALVEHAAQEFLAGRQPGRTVVYLDVGAQRGQHIGVTRRSAAADKHGNAQATPGYRGHHRDIGEGEAGCLGEVGELAFDPWRGGVQIGPQRARPQPGQPGRQRLHRGLRAVDAQHQVRPLRRLGFARGVGDAFGRGHRRVITPDTHARRDQVRRDRRTSLAQAQDRDHRRVSALGHHTRGWSAATLAPGVVSGRRPATPAPGSAPAGAWLGASYRGCSRARGLSPGPGASDCLKYSLISSRGWASSWSKGLSTFCSPIASGVR